MDIAEFLEARYAEKEAAAKAAGYGAAGDYLWQEVDPDRMPGLIGTACGDVVTFNQGTPAYAVSPSPGQAAHIALNDPAAVLADIEAKRAILAEHRPSYPVTYPKPSGQPTCGTCHDGGFDWEPPAWPCRTVRLLATPFASHPDCDPSWRPEP